MKQSIIFLVLLFAFLLPNQYLQAQPGRYVPLIIDIDEADLPVTAQRINDLIDPSFGLTVSNILDFLTDATIQRSKCISPQDCPAVASPVVVEELLHGVMIEFEGLLPHPPIYELQAGFLEYDKPDFPSFHNYLNVVMEVAGAQLFFDWRLTNHTILVFSIVGPLGRADLQAIVIAEKNILRSN